MTIFESPKIFCDFGSTILDGFDRTHFGTFIWKKKKLTIELPLNVLAKTKVSCRKIRNFYPPTSWIQHGGFCGRVLQCNRLNADFAHILNDNMCFIRFYCDDQKYFDSTYQESSNLVYNFIREMKQ